MSLFLAEYKTALPDSAGGFISNFMPFEADTLQLAQREVERVVNTTNIDHAILYQAIKVTRASRVVSTTEMLNSPKVVIGSALEGSNTVRDAA